VEYLKVKNWEKFQQYNDGRPLHWIKVFRAILTDYDFTQLSDAEFGRLVKIWLLASQVKNKIPNDPKWIADKCSMRQKPNINTYIQLGMLIPYEIVRNRTETPTLSVPRKEKKRKEISAHFETFWTAYPKKKSKGQAKKAFQKIQPDEHLLETMLSTIEKAKKSDDWQKDGGQYIPYPATWLNAEGWADVIETPGLGRQLDPSRDYKPCTKCQTLSVQLYDGLCAECYRKETP
jgi:hypothetical protein